MLQGICKEPGGAITLQPGHKYYLFENGHSHYYVSRFPNKGAHFGCYEARLFDPIQQEAWPEEPADQLPELRPGALYKAQLIWRRPGYKATKLQEYFLEPKKTHTYFYEDQQLKTCRGCFPLHWFSDFIEVERLDQLEELPEPEVMLLERENGQLAFF